MAKGDIHFSDGKKATCGAKNVQAVTDEQKVTCKKCNFFLAQKAEQKGDPLVKARVKNMDLNDGVDFAFSYEGKGYHLINNAAHLLPKSVIEHLKRIAYPYKRYVSGQESGRAMQVAGRYNRFVVQEL